MYSEYHREKLTKISQREGKYQAAMVTANEARTDDADAASHGS